MKWGHDKLAEDLADQLGLNSDRIIWTNMQMGSSGSPRPDVFTMMKSYSAPRPISYEIKVSESDLRGDVTKGKWQTYLPFSSGVYFAFPAGMVAHDLIPKECGIIVRHEQVWRTARKPVLRPVQLPQEMMLKLLIDGIDRARGGIRIRQADQWSQLVAIRKKHGEEAAEVLRDVRAARQTAEHMLREAEHSRDEARKRIESEVNAVRNTESALIREICEAFGIDEPNIAERWGFARSLEQTVARRLKDLSADERLARAQQSISNLRSALDAALSAVTLPEATA